MKRMMKRAGIFCGIYWALLMAQLLLLQILTDSWMLLGVLLLVTGRLMLWLSPFALSAIVWIAGCWKPKCEMRHIAVTNVVVLVLNVLSFVAWRLLMDGWY